MPQARNLGPDRQSSNLTNLHETRKTVWFIAAMAALSLLVLITHACLTQNYVVSTVAAIACLCTCGFFMIGSAPRMYSMINFWVFMRGQIFTCDPLEHQEVVEWLCECMMDDHLEWAPGIFIVRTRQQAMALQMTWGSL